MPEVSGRFSLPDKEISKLCGSFIPINEKIDELIEFRIIF